MKMKYTHNGFTHLFNKYLLGSRYVSDTVLGAGDTIINKIDPRNVEENCLVSRLAHNKYRKNVSYDFYVCSILLLFIVLVIVIGSYYILYP